MNIFTDAVRCCFGYCAGESGATECAAYSTDKAPRICSTIPALLTLANGKHKQVSEHMSHAIKYDFIPLEDYLADERDVDIRSEYVDGLVYAMAGASETHNTIAGSLYAQIEINLKDGCRAWQSDMKVVIRNKGQKFSYYPDIIAACGENTDDLYVRTNPILIVEVLSDSTARTDLKEKFDNYISTPTLLEYVVVSQDVPLVRLWRRRTSWEREMYRADDTFRLESVELDVAVQHIYRRVRKEVELDALR